MIPKDGDLFQIWCENAEGKTVFEGWVLGKDEVEDTPKRVFRIYAFIDDPKKVIDNLTTKYGPITYKYGMVPYTGIFICNICNHSYSSKECLEEHQSEH